VSETHFNCFGSMSKPPTIVFLKRQTFAVDSQFLDAEMGLWADRYEMALELMLQQDGHELLMFTHENYVSAPTR
jgi:hypothetical protein